MGAIQVVREMVRSTAVTVNSIAISRTRRFRVAIFKTCGTYGHGRAKKKKYNSGCLKQNFDLRSSVSIGIVLKCKCAAFLL